jgi:probable HAF family extracellular repeat protein
MFIPRFKSFLLVGCMVFGALLAQAQTTASCTFHVFTIPVSGGIALPQGINKYGTIVGFVDQTNGGIVGFTRSSNGAVSIFRAPNSGDTIIRHRNDKGVNTGSYSLAGVTASNRGFVKTSSTFQTIKFPGASQTFVSASNNFGVIVGDYIGSDNHFHGFKLQNGKFTTIHPNGAVDTFLGGINDSGVIVGSFSTGGADNQGFVDRNGAITTLTFPGEVGFGGTTLSDINNTGVIVGMVWTGADTHQAFLHNSGGFKFIPVPVSQGANSDASGISNSNVIVGSAGAQAFTATCH